MAYQGNVYYKVSVIDDFSLWKCEMSKSQQPSCRATIEVAKGKVNVCVFLVEIKVFYIKINII